MKIGMKAAVVAAICGVLACAHTAETTPPAETKPQPETTKPETAGIEARSAQKIAGEEVLAQKPTVPELAPFEAPVPTVRTLSNGLKVYVLQRPESQIQALELVIKKGATSDPANLPGLASMTAEMLEAGSAGKSQAEIAAAVDAIGGSLSVGTGGDVTVVSMSALTTQLPQLVKLLADVSLRPNLAEADFKKLQSQRVAELIAARARPEVSAELAFRAAIYGPHPLGRPTSGTPESVQAIQLSQVKSFFQSVAPSQAALIAVGGANIDQVIPQLEKAFGGWKGTRVKDARPASAQVPAERPRLVAVDLPGKPQAVLRIGLPAVPRSSPDALALRVLNTILGGSFTSRLNLNLREKNGYSYGASSRFEFGTGPGPFLVATNVKTDVTGPALREALHELNTIVSQPLSPEDLQKGKSLLAADLVRNLETSTSAAGAISEIFLYDLPLDEYRTFVARLKALSAEDVQAAVRRVLDPAKMTITIAGDLSKVEPQLKAEPALQSLPAAQRRTAEGTLAK